MRIAPPFATFTRPGAIQAAGDGYRIWLAPINSPSDDGRVIVDTLGHRAGRLPLMFSDTEQGHGDAIHVGTFTNVQIVEADGVRWAVTDDVEWDNDPEAVDARRMVDEGQFRGVSIHMGRGRFAEVCPNGNGGYTEVDAEDLEVVVDDEHPDVVLDVRAPCDEPLWGAFDSTIAAVTIVAIPAFESARIEPTMTVSASGSVLAPTISGNITVNGQDLLSDYGVTVRQVMEHAGVTTPDIQAAGILDAPPAEWFTDPGFGEDGTDERLVYDDRNGQYGCPLTVTADGRVFGHLALWKTCHTGYRDSCVSPPRGADMSPFHQCRVNTADGATLAVGPLVVDEGHAPVAWSTDRVTRHYADTTLAAAYVVAGEDRHGIWVAGALSPRATPEMVETLKRHSLSGDWRSQGGRMGLYAAVSVNSPGFPIPQVLVAAGEPVGMITFGPAQPDREPSDMELVADAMRGLDSKIDRLAAALGVFDQANPEPCDECGDNAEPVEAAVTSTDDVESFLVEDLLSEL